MQKELCLGLGIVLFCVAALLYFSRYERDDSDIRVVHQAEAKMILGGGQNGYQTATVDGETCNDGLNGCSGKGYVLTGQQVKQGFMPSGTTPCGGANCSNAWVLAGACNAPE